MYACRRPLRSAAAGRARYYQSGATCGMLKPSTGAPTIGMGVRGRGTIARGLWRRGLMLCTVSTSRRLGGSIASATAHRLAGTIGPVQAFLRTFPTIRSLVWGHYSEASPDVHSLLAAVAERASDAWREMGCRDRGEREKHFGAGTMY